MKALILYVVFVAIGAAISSAIGIFVERQTSPALSLIVFLTLFFANFVVSWFAVVLVIDGSLRNMQGTQEQRDAEKTGQEVMAKRVT